ncbi:hypothetical protein BDW59DRAFT_160009 [Aspergillus cavernicola]|uniref:Uncharacterized protein n=1 Tax=Aspergillus cavernicola TaxID=176166 RepID=A0ABR4IMT0_9EURO
MKSPTEEFPFDGYYTPQPPTIQQSNKIRVEVGSRSPNPGPPAADIVKIRVYRRSGNTATPSRPTGVVAEEVRFRAGDVVVRGDTRANSRMEMGSRRELESSLW